MLPTDLEAVSSPDSNRSTADDKTNSPGMKVKVESTEDVKPPLPKTDDDQHEGRHSMELDDEESPPFEPIAADAKPPLPPTHPETCTIKTEESQDSNISGLTSQDSIESEAAKELNPDPIQKEEIKAETVDGVPPIDSPPLPAVKEESQLSQVSSDTQNSSRFENNTSTEEPLKMDISEEAQMPSRFPVPDRNANNEVVTSFDLQKEVITFEQVKREKDDDDAAVADAVAPVPSTFAEDPKGPQKPANTTDSQAPETAPPKSNPTESVTTTDAGNLCPSGELNKILIKANMTEDTEESLLDSGDSMDLKIVESDSRGSVSGSNQSVETAGNQSKKDEPSRSSSHRRSHHHGDQHHRSSSSSASHHRSSNKSSSAKDRSHHRSSRDHHKSSDRSRSRKESDKRPRDKGRDRDNKEKERNKDREKEKQKRSNGDSCKDRSIERRSTDRDSNDGANPGSQKTAGGGSGNIAEKGTTSTASGSTSSENHQKASSSSSTPTKSQSKAKDGPASPSAEANELSDRLQQPIVVDQFLDGKELNLQMRAPTSTDPSKGPRKPKIAANLKEAMKLMRVRKMMDLQRSKEEEKAAVGLNKGIYGEDVEQSLHYFPDESVTSKFPESASEKWWKRVKQQHEEKELVDEVKKFLEQDAPSPPPKDDKTLKPPPAKKIKVQQPKPLNGLTTTTTGDFVDMDDYQEAEVVLDDLLSASVPLTENNNVHTENKNYGMTFNKLGKLLLGKLRRTV